MKYTIGDKVKVRDDLIVDVWYNNVKITPQHQHESSRKYVTIAYVFPVLGLYAIKENQLLYNDEIIVGRFSEPGQPKTSELDLLLDLYSAEICSLKFELARKEQLINDLLKIMEAKDSLIGIYEIMASLTEKVRK